MTTPKTLAEQAAEIRDPKTRPDWARCRLAPDACNDGEKCDYDDGGLFPQLSGWKRTGKPCRRCGGTGIEPGVTSLLDRIDELEKRVARLLVPACTDRNPVPDCQMCNGHGCEEATP